MDNIRDTLTNVSKSMFKTSKGIIKTTRLAIDLSTEEGKLKSLYIEIGKKVHEIYTYGGSLGKFFDEKYAELMDCEQKIDALRREINAAKGSRACAKCGKTVSSSSEFCPKCGNKMGDDAPPVQETAAPVTDMRNDCPQERAAAPEPYAAPLPAPVSVPGVKRCQICGAENDADNKFCFSCGRIL